MELRDVATRALGKYRTTQSVVVGGLRDAILSGVLVGGQPLRQEEIAESFGVSRSPVREALRQLEGEGLVSFTPHRGAVVSELSYGEIVEITEVRIVLETMAMRKALPLIGEEDLRRAEEVLRDIDREENLVPYWGELNWRFHATLFAPADRPWLLSTIKAQHTAFERYIRVHLALSDYEQPQREHYELLERIRRKDPEEEVVQFLCKHIQNTSESLLASIKKDPEKAKAITP